MIRSNMAFRLHFFPNKQGRCQNIQTCPKKWGISVTTGPPPLETVRTTLQTRYPQWFASDPDAVPVIVRLRTSTAKTAGTLENLKLTLWYPVHLFSIGLVPIVIPQSIMDFETSFKTGPESTAGLYPYRGTSKIGAGNKWTATDSLFPDSRGWHRYDTKTRGNIIPRPRFDVDEKLKLDAFCASVALAVQRLTQEERKALRENNEAWWLDAKQGNKRNRPIAVVKESAPDSPEAPKVSPDKPRILSQEWNSQTRKGEIEFAVDTGLGLDAARSWLVDEYLPDYSKTMGVVVSADAPDSVPSSVILADAPLEKGNSTYLLRFTIAE